MKQTKAFLQKYRKFTPEQIEAVEITSEYLKLVHNLISGQIPKGILNDYTIAYDIFEGLEEDTNLRKLVVDIIIK